MFSYADYYPFGWKIPTRQANPNDYRFGYQGEFAEQEEETGWNAFELRMYDGRVGRWMTIDPMEEFYSPYLAMGNDPINLTDPSGGSTDGWINGPNGIYWDSKINSQNEFNAAGLGDDYSYLGQSGAWNIGDGFSFIGLDNGNFELWAPVVDYNASSNHWNVNGQFLTEGELFQSGKTNGALDRYLLTQADENISIAYIKRRIQDNEASGQVILGTIGLPLAFVGGLEVAGASVSLSNSLSSSIKTATGGLKQWARVGKSYSIEGQFKTYGLRWGASPRYKKKIGNKLLRSINQRFRKTKLPGNNWRVKDSGHLHFWKLF